jgi:hypothetical protein
MVSGWPKPPIKIAIRRVLVNLTGISGNSPIG